MVVEITDDFDLEKIADSGQCFRWQKISENEYRIIHTEKCLYIEKLSETQYQLDCAIEDACFCMVCTI